MPGPDTLSHPTVDAVLSAADALLGMQMVFLGGFSDDTFTFRRVHGSSAPVKEGQRIPAGDSFCSRMLAGAPPVTANAAVDPAYRDAGARQLGICSYVGVPVVDERGDVVATLCAADTGSVPVDAASVEVLRALATVIAAHLEEHPTEGVVIRRTGGGWRVGRAHAAELVEAMALADLLTVDEAPPPRPTPAGADVDELTRLRTAVRQLEYALTARVAVEQAIGVLSGRLRVQPREAFERLRNASRSRGRRVHDLSRDVVASVTDPSVRLPAELSAS